MKKSQVEQILIRVMSREEEALSMKIYKDGTTTRRGMGGLPEIGISAISFFPDDRFFAPLLEKVPEKVLAQPIMVDEGEGIEYVIAFYGESRNGETGESADWGLNTGIRLTIDPQKGKPQSPVYGLVDHLSLTAAELTNSWYFDVMVQARWQAKSEELPEETLISLPNTPEEINKAWGRYVLQAYQSPMDWKLSQYAKGKLFEREGKKYHCLIREGEEKFGIDFLPAGPLPEEHTRKTQPKTPPKSKKPWWKPW